MKAVLTVKMKNGYLVIERDIETVTVEEVIAGMAVDEDSYSYRDKVGRLAVDLLSPPPPPRPPPPDRTPLPGEEVKSDVPF